MVLLHGLALDGRIRDEVVRLYTDQVRFIVPDLRGHGKTETGVAFEVAQYSRCGSVVVLPGVGHLPMLEEPLALGALIVSML